MPANNLEIFRKVLQEYFPSKEISSPDEFKRLINHLCDHKLLHPEEVKKLIHRFCDEEEQTSSLRQTITMNLNASNLNLNTSHLSATNKQNKSKQNRKIEFPLTLDMFEYMIMTEFGDKDNRLLLQNLQSMQNKLRNIKGFIAIWKDHGLSLKQSKELETIFQRGNNKIEDMLKNVIKNRQQLENISQQEIQMIAALNQWVQMQNINPQYQDYQDYQTINSKVIQECFHQAIVKEAYYKNTQKIKNQPKQKSSHQNMSTVCKRIAFDKKNDSILEVILVSKHSINFTQINQQLLTFNAYKQLTLSPYFKNFLGYNTIADHENYQYFVEHLEGYENLSQKITKCQKLQLTEDTYILKYWLVLVYQTFYDLYLMCGYTAKLPISLQDFHVGESGLRICLENVKFIGRREDNDEVEEKQYEAKLLRNMGEVMLQMLMIEKHDEIEEKIQKIQNKCLLHCLLNSEANHKNYEERKVKEKITFFNIQTHPLFESKNQILGENIVETYERYFR